MIGSTSTTPTTRTEPAAFLRFLLSIEEGTIMRPLRFPAPSSPTRPGIASCQPVRREAPSTSGRTRPSFLGATFFAFLMLKVGTFSHVQIMDSRRNLTPPFFNTEKPYPIVPSFERYFFPRKPNRRSMLPDSWVRLRPDLSGRRLGSYGFPIQVRVHDEVCVVTGSGLARDVAHLIPVKYQTWFETQVMPDFISPGNGIDDAGNGIALRRDIHAIFDDLDICFVPKHSHWACHVTSLDPSQELVDLYHNISLQPFRGVWLEFLFARFAMNVFRHSDFMTRSLPGTVSLVHTDDYGTLETRQVDNDWIKSRQALLGLRRPL